MALEQSELFQTFAEISATVAGFTGIVGVFGRQYSRSDPRVDAVRLRGMVENALLAVAFALVPVALDHAEFAAARVWVLSSLGLALAWGALTVTSLGRYRELAALGVYRFDRVAYTAYAFAGITILALVLNALGLFAGATPMVYFAGVVSPTLISAVLLLRMLTTQVGRGYAPRAPAAVEDEAAEEGS